MSAVPEPPRRDYEAIIDAYADEKRTDAHLANQRRVWVMLAEAGKMQVSEGTLEERSDNLDRPL